MSIGLSSQYSKRVCYSLDGLLDVRWLDLAETELDILLVLILVRDHHKLLQELKSILALINGAVLDTNLEQPLGLIDHIDILDSLRSVLGHLDEILHDLVDLVYDLTILLVLAEELDKQVELVLIDVDDLHLVNILVFLLRVEVLILHFF